jgi:hypothetical protein
MSVSKVRDRLREVYFVQAFELKLIKIGVTNDTQRRVVSMQTLSPDHLAVLGVEFCHKGGALEGRLHQRFEAYRQHGEWFYPAPEILAYVDEHTMPLAEVAAAKARLLEDWQMIERIQRGNERRQIRWLKANGFAHMVEE